MLEVCFGDSVKGALAIAQHCESGVIGGAIGFITDKKGLPALFAKRKALKEYRRKQAELQKQAVNLGSTREDIVGISLLLSQGDIDAPICMGDCPRKGCVREMFSFDRYHEQMELEDSIQEFWTGCVNDLEKLKSNPPQIRVWLDSTPDAQCGLLFLADLLKTGQTEIHVVALPERVTRQDNSIVEYRGWGEVEPQLYGSFLENETVLTKREVLDLAGRWQLLKAENAPLRVVENGSVISADISYYDDLIRKEYPRDSCTIAQIIGAALGKQKVLVGDVFIAKRIQHLIANGELVVSGKTGDGFYRTVVKRAE